MQLLPIEFLPQFISNLEKVPPKFFVHRPGSPIQAGILRNLAIRIPKGEREEEHDIYGFGLKRRDLF